MFGYLNAISQVFLLLGPIIASTTMSVGFLFPLWLSVVLNSLAAAIVLFLPDTRTCRARSSSLQWKDNPETEPLIPQQDSPHGSSSESDAVRSSSGVNEDEEIPSSNPGRGSTCLVDTANRRISTEVKALRLLLFSNNDIRLFLSILLITRLGPSSMDILIQYISVRYHWSYAQVRHLLMLHNWD